jgi:hypothetical protein
MSFLNRFRYVFIVKVSWSDSLGYSESGPIVVDVVVGIEVEPIIIDVDVNRPLSSPAHR